MKPRIRTSVRCVALAFGGLSAVVTALPAAAQQQLDRVEITGSALRRVDAETALPVTVIKTEDLAKQGITTAEQAMSVISANQSNFGISASIGGTTGGKAEADLRGLSGPTGVNSNKTLVLLNGRRIANHAFDAAAVDLNAIPLAAVDRIEVLRDGASAIYGTDAIGGVINFILRRDFQGIEVSAEAQMPEKAGGDTHRATLAAGFGSLAKQGFNIMGTVDWRKQKVVEAVQRDFSKTGILKGNITAGTSGTSFPGDINGFEPTLPNCNPPKSIPNAAGTACRYDFTQDIDIVPENEQITAMLRGSLALGTDHTLSAEYLRANNKGTARVAPAPNSHYLPESSPFYPANTPAANRGSIPDLDNPGNFNEASPCLFDNCVPGGVVNWRQVPIGKRTSHDDTTTERTMAELQGLAAGWDYRAAVGTSKNKSTASVSAGYPNDSLVQRGLWDGLINPFGAQTPAGQAAIDAAQVKADTLIGTSKVDFVDLRVNKDLFQLPAGPLSAAFGAEYRKEKASFEATDITGELGSLGIDPDSDTAGNRKVKALFAEFGIPIMKGLDMTLAARWDDYSDFGNTFNPKVGLRYQPIRQVLLRGSYNKGFRAPTLYEIYQPLSLTFTSDNYDDPVLCPGGVAVPGASAGVVCGQQVLQRNSGPGGAGRPINSLEPEKSDAFSFGVVFEPMTNLSIGVDFWDIKIKNLIGGLPEQAIFGNPSKYTDRFVRCSTLPGTPGPGLDRSDIDACLNVGFDPIAYIDTPNENLGELKTRGIDLSVLWRSGATPYGNWSVGLDGTYIDKYKYQRERGGDFINAVGRYSDNAPVFRWQHVLTVGWNMGSWGATIGQRHKSGYTDQDEVNEVSSYTLYDMSVTWTGIKNLTLTAGIKNILDEDPPLSVQSTTFQRGYDPRFTDPLGRTFLVRASYKFF